MWKSLTDLCKQTRWQGKLKLRSYHQQQMSWWRHSCRRRKKLSQKLPSSKWLPSRQPARCWRTILVWFHHWKFHKARLFYINVRKNRQNCLAFWFVKLSPWTSDAAKGEADVGDEGDDAHADEDAIQGRVRWSLSEMNENLKSSQFWLLLHFVWYLNLCRLSFS